MRAFQPHIWSVPTAAAPHHQPAQDSIPQHPPQVSSTLRTRSRGCSGGKLQPSRGRTNLSPAPGNAAGAPTHPASVPAPNWVPNRVVSPQQGASVASRGDSLSPCLTVLASPSLPFSLAPSRCAGAPSRAGELCSPPLALPELSPWLCPCCPHFCSSPGLCWLQTLRESNTGVTSSRTHHLLLLSLVPPLLGHPFRCTLARPSLLLPAEAGFHRELITLCSCPTDSQCPKCPKLPPTKKGAGSASSRNPGSFGSKGETGQGSVTLEGSRSPHPASGAGAPSECFPAAPAGQGGAWPGRTLQEGHKEVLCSAP